MASQQDKIEKPQKKKPDVSNFNMHYSYAQTTASENVRKRAMESFGESREREGLGGPIKKRVDKDREAMHYLKGRHDEEIEIKKMEMALMERKLILQERAQEESIALKRKSWK